MCWITRDLGADGGAPTPPERSFTVHRDRAEPMRPASTDADRLVQVFINLISNARKYCDSPAPELTISVSVAAGERVMVDFIDNGSGIPSGAQSLIFEKFARVRRRTARAARGWGWRSAARSCRTSAATSPIWPVARVVPFASFCRSRGKSPRNSATVKAFVTNPALDPMGR